MSAISNRASPYPSLVEALRLLPDIRPVCERDRLGEAKHEASGTRSRTASINGVSVTLLELEELFVDSERGTPRVSPTGAALLLRLFSEGAFDCVASRPVGGGLELLTQYSQGQASLIEPRFWGRARRQASPGTTGRVTRKKPAAVADVSVVRAPPGVHVTVHRLA